MVAAMSPYSVDTSTMRVNPQVRVDQNATTPQVKQDAAKSTQAFRTDTVTISQQALQKLASDGDTKAKEVTEKNGEKSSEKVRGKA
jgi:hypothetical protein